MRAASPREARSELPNEDPAIVLARELMAVGVPLWEALELSHNVLKLVPPEPFCTT